jgi:urea transport system ATP-binding protein
MLSVEAVDLYYGASHTLRRVSLMARKGEVTCILGRNGVGKTSLLRAICGLQPIRSGRILWEDRLLNGLPPHERARWRTWRPALHRWRAAYATFRTKSSPFSRC